MSDISSYNLASIGINTRKNSGITVYESVEKMIEYKFSRQDFRLISEYELPNYIENHSCNAIKNVDKFMMDNPDVNFFNMGFILEHMVYLYAKARDVVSSKTGKTSSFDEIHPIYKCRNAKTGEALYVDGYSVYNYLMRVKRNEEGKKTSKTKVTKTPKSTPEILNESVENCFHYLKMDDATFKKYCEFMGNFKNYEITPKSVKLTVL